MSDSMKVPLKVNHVIHPWQHISYIILFCKGVKFQQFNPPKSWHGYDSVSVYPNGTRTGQNIESWERHSSCPADLRILRTRLVMKKAGNKRMQLRQDGPAICPQALP
jgi:hypothetical protein